MWRGGAIEVPMASSYYDSLLIFNVFVIPSWEISSSACKHKIFTWSASAADIVYPRFTHSDGSGRRNPWNGSWCDAITCQCLLPNVINSMFRVKLCHSCSLLPLVLGKLLGEKGLCEDMFHLIFFKALEFLYLIIQVYYYNVNKCLIIHLWCPYYCSTPYPHSLTSISLLVSPQ